MDIDVTEHTGKMNKSTSNEVNKHTCQFTRAKTALKRFCLRCKLSRRSPCTKGTMVDNKQECYSNISSSVAQRSNIDVRHIV